MCFKIILSVGNWNKFWKCYFFKVDAHIQQLDQYLRKLEEQRRGMFLLSPESVTYMLIYVAAVIWIMDLLRAPVYVLCRGCKDGGVKQVVNMSKWCLVLVWMKILCSYFYYE